RTGSSFFFSSFFFTKGLHALLTEGNLHYSFYVVDGFQHVESHFLHTTMRVGVLLCFGLGRWSGVFHIRPGGVILMSAGLFFSMLDINEFKYPLAGHHGKCFALELGIIFPIFFFISLIQELHGDT
ncbi:hypothetical protein ACJX0J_025625, partial [Zea mays]